MKNWMKAIELKMLMNQMEKMRDQMEDVRFRKPWTTGGDRKPLFYMAMGAGIAWLIASLYKNRNEVADFCSTCGATLKETWERSGIKEKTMRSMDKGREAREAMASGNGQEPSY